MIVNRTKTNEEVTRTTPQTPKTHVQDHPLDHIKTTTKILRPPKDGHATKRQPYKKAPWQKGTLQKGTQQKGTLQKGTPFI